MLMRSSLWLVLAAWTLWAAPAADAQSPAQAKRFIIGFVPGATSTQRESALKSLGAAPVDLIEDFNAVVAEVPAGPAEFAVLEDKALANPLVAAIEEDVYIPNWLVDAEPSFQAMPLPSWASVLAAIGAFKPKPVPWQRPALPPGVDANEVPWGVLRVDAPAAWSKTMGEGVRVAVVDTGIDGSHPDLQGQVAGCYNAFDSNASCMDDNSHGTHVSGTIAGLLDGKGVVGVAPKARLYAVKVLDKNGGANLTSVIKGLVWCANNNIQVANMSLGAPYGFIFLHWAVQYAHSKGVTVVAAAGNDGKSVGYPAAYPEVIAVSASDPDDKIADFSSRGDRVAFIAPGVHVKSSIPGGGYDFYDGTSMATPHVTGLAALAVSRGAGNPEAVRAALNKAAKRLPGLGGLEQGGGMIDAALLAQ